MRSLPVAREELGCLDKGAEPDVRLLDAVDLDDDLLFSVFEELLLGEDLDDDDDDFDDEDLLEDDDLLLEEEDLLFEDLLPEEEEDFFCFEDDAD